MKNLQKLKPIALFLVASLFLASCSSDNNEDIAIPDDPEAEFDGELSVFDTGEDNRNVVINGANLSNNLASVKVAFRSSENSMRRLYVTQNVANSGEVPFEFAVSGITVDDKKDGSLDLTSANRNAFEFEIPFPAPTSADANIVYTLWATTGRGDFRDISKRNAIGETALGTITINGSGSNGNGMNAFSAKLLAAPLGNGTSNTFISLFNGEIYKISDGEEFAALWDFGYFFGNSNRASLASASNYPSDIVNIPTISGVAQTDLNNCFFAKSTLTTTDFDNVSSSADLNSIVTPTAERVTQLEVGDIIEFEDQYGNKGLLNITAIVDGFGNDGSIEFDIKVQN